MDLHSIISYHPHPHRSLYKKKLKKSLSFCSPSCHALVVASVMVFLPPSLPEAVLIKALNVRESTHEDWWRDVEAVCSQGGWGVGVGVSLSQSGSAT